MNVAVRSWVPSTGVVSMNVSGGVESWMVHVNDAGVGSTLFDVSFARTWKVCEPTESPDSVAQVPNAPVSSLHS